MGNRIDAELLTDAGIARLRKSLAAAQAKSMKCAERRHALPAGSTRARVTTANANWMRAAEHRDRLSDLLDAVLAERTTLTGAST